MSGTAHIEEGFIFEPEVVQALSRLFDDEWKVIGPAFEGQQQTSVDSVRTILAKLLLHIARKGVTDPDELRDQLRRMMRHAYTGLARASG